jgi:hypothetical protein
MLLGGKHYVKKIQKPFGMKKVLSEQGRAIQVIVLITEACNLSTVCKMPSDILLSSLTQYVHEIFGDYHCEI